MESSYYLTELKEHLWKAYREAFRRKDVHNHNEALSAAIKSPCPRYWVSSKEAARQISLLEKGLPLTCRSASKRSIILAVYERYKQLKGKPAFRGMSIRFTACYAVNSPAPQFYISERHARRIIDGIRRKGGCRG